MVFLLLFQLLKIYLYIYTYSHECSHHTNKITKIRYTHIKTTAAITTSSSFNKLVESYTSSRKKIIPSVREAADTPHYYGYIIYALGLPEISLQITEWWY